MIVLLALMIMITKGLWLSVDRRLIFACQLFERNQVIVENEKREKQITENALILITLQEKTVLSKTLGLKRMRKFCQNKKLTINFWNDLKNGWKKSCNIYFAFEIWFCRPKWVECGSETSFIEHVCKFEFCFEKGSFSHLKELR